MKDYNIMYIICDKVMGLFNEDWIALICAKKKYNETICSNHSTTLVKGGKRFDRSEQQ